MKWCVKHVSIEDNKRETAGKNFYFIQFLREQDVLPVCPLNLLIRLLYRSSVGCFIFPTLLNLRWN